MVTFRFQRSGMAGKTQRNHAHRSLLFLICISCYLYFQASRRGLPFSFAERLRTKVKAVLSQFGNCLWRRNERVIEKIRVGCCWRFSFVFIAWEQFPHFHVSTYDGRVKTLPCGCVLATVFTCASLWWSSIIGNEARSGSVYALFAEVYALYAEVSKLCTLCRCLCSGSVPGMVFRSWQSANSSISSSLHLSVASLYRIGGRAAIIAAREQEGHKTSVLHKIAKWDVMIVYYHFTRHFCFRPRQIPKQRDHAHALFCLSILRS